jgi:hypothetical protein
MGKTFKLKGNCDSSNLHYLAQIGLHLVKIAKYTDLPENCVSTKNKSANTGTIQSQN